VREADEEEGNGIGINQRRFFATPYVCREKR
jgi:hypothetical protein